MKNIISPDFQKRKVLIFILKIILEFSVKKVTQWIGGEEEDNAVFSFLFLSKDNIGVDPVAGTRTLAYCLSRERSPPISLS